MRPGPHPAGDNRAGLVVIDESGRDVPVLVRLGDELRIRGPENASTGYVWQIGSPEENQVGDSQRAGLTWDGDAGVDPAEQVDDAEVQTRQKAPVVLVGENYSDLFNDRSSIAEGDATALGTAGGKREFVFLADHPGRHELMLSLRRPWESFDVADVLTTRVRVGPRHALDGFAENQVRSHVARMAAGGAR
jgi:predicted secreted protein